MPAQWPLYQYKAVGWFVARWMVLTGCSLYAACVCHSLPTEFIVIMLALRCT